MQSFVNDFIFNYPSIVYIIYNVYLCSALREDAMQVLILMLVLLFLLRKFYIVEEVTLPACRR